jgi:hypothetical protein
MKRLTTFFPGTRVMVFDSRRFVDDVKTPLSMTMRPATVVCWYGRRAHKVLGGYTYPSLIDIVFDGEETVSRGHFTDHLSAAHHDPIKADRALRLATGTEQP